jgi:hypothetical protein
MEPFMKPPLEMNFSTTEQLSLSERWRRWKETVQLSPSRRREAPCEGTNSPRLFTPGETKALAKSKVHQISRASVTNGVEWVVVVTGHPH